MLLEDFYLILKTESLRFSFDFWQSHLLSPTDLHIVVLWTIDVTVVAGAEF